MQGRRKRIASIASIGVLVVAGGSGCFMDSFQNKTIEGTFSSTNAEFGTWTVSPTSCVDGIERGFEGVAFGFGAGPIKEIRLDGAQDGNNVVEIHLADEQATIRQVFEPKCKFITGNVTRSNVTINDRHMFRLVGHVEFDCPEQGISGNATFDGCLPQTL